MLIRVADGRKAYIYTQYVVIAVFVFMNFFALTFILSNCTPVRYVGPHLLSCSTAGC